MKHIISGLESSGKSYLLAVRADNLLERNKIWKDKFGFSRPIGSNMKFSDEFEARAKSYGIPLVYWRDLDELVAMEHCDIIMDEVGNYFDARGWESLSLDVRRWLTQAAKCGVDIYGGAQDFAQVDVAFRRLVSSLEYVSKWAGSRRPSKHKPPVGRVWGLLRVRGLEAVGYDENDPKFTDVIGEFLLIRRKYTEIFYTGQKIVRSKPPPLRHISRQCNEPGCGFCKVSHL